MFKSTIVQQTVTSGELNKEYFYSNISFSDIKNLLNSRTKGDIVHILYHDNCQDGMVASYLMDDYFDVNYESHSCTYKATGVSYNQEPPEIEPGSLVIILDFSYSPEILNAMATAGNTVVVLDHHVSAIKKIVNYDGFIRFNYILSKERSSGGDCGSSLVFRFINNITDDEIDFRFYNTPDANVVWLAREQDLWLHDGDIKSDALAFNYGISALDEEEWSEQSLRIGECLYEYSFIDKTIESGREILNSSVEKIQKIILDTPYDASFIIDGVKTTMKCPLLEKKYASLAGSILSENKPFSITFSEVPDGFVYSLRSRKYGMDVSKIANLYGGGGHTHAAGFISALTPDELFATAKDLGNFQRTVGNAVGV